MKDRRDYEKAIEIIAGVIRAWDPYCLLAQGAPLDEFDSEIAQIAAKSRGFTSAGAVAQAMSEIFLASFGQDEKFSATDCCEPAKRIFMELGRANLLPAA